MSAAEAGAGAALRFRARQAASPRCTDCGKPAPHLRLRCDRCKRRRERVAAAQREYRERNRELVAAAKHEYYERNRERLAAAQRNGRRLTPACRACGGEIAPTGKRGRPFRTCERCRSAAARRGQECAA